jgi:hypothetical protein
VEIRYEGTVIGQASAASGSIDDGGTLFLDTQEPMPVGTKLELHAGGGQVAQVRVVRVSEASDTVAAGMIVRAVGAHDPIDIPMPPLIPPRPAAAPPPTAMRPGLTTKGMGVAPAPVAPVAVPRAAMPGPIPSAVKGEIHTPAPAARAPATPPPPPVVVQDHQVPDDASGDEGDGVPEAVGGDGHNGSNELAGPAEVSGVIETGGSTAELPSMGNGANRRRRSRRRR